jgi:ATP-binding cassette subfamily B protein
MGGPAARMMAGAMPTEKLQDFKGSTKRLLGLMKPQRLLVAVVLLFGVASVTLSVLGPKLLGSATDIIFSGFVGKLLPAGMSKAQAIAQLRAQGDNGKADLLSSTDAVPGQGIDFTRLEHLLAWVVVVYVFAWVFGVMQGRLTARVVQTTMYGLRQSVEVKLARLPLSYFDQQPRGEVLSRATNDTDNIAQTLQQTFSQLITSVLTIIGVLAFMFWISPLLAIIALVTVPVSIWITTRIGKRSQPQFVDQWSTTGKLNGHIEEMFTGHSLVKVFGRQHEAIETFEQHNQRLYASSFRAQFISGLIQPAMMFIGNVNYVLVAVVGGLRVASGSLSLGDVQAFIQYSRQFSQPLSQVASMANMIQSGVASAERVFALLDAPEQSPEPAFVGMGRVRGRVAFEDVSFRYLPDKPLIDHLSLTVEPGQTVAIVGPTGAGKTTLVNLLMRFYDVTSGRITLDGVDIATMGGGAHSGIVSDPGRRTGGRHDRRRGRRRGGRLRHGRRRRGGAGVPAGGPPRRHRGPAARRSRTARRLGRPPAGVACRGTRQHQSTPLLPAVRLGRRRRPVRLPGDPQRRDHPRALPPIHQGGLPSVPHHASANGVADQPAHPPIHSAVTERPLLRSTRVLQHPVALSRRDARPAADEGTI